jgi:hypothetical protein
MPGAQPIGPRYGGSAELLAEFVLSSMAFVSRVPRQEDVGHDLLCVLAERSGRMMLAGPFFTVQVKNRRQRLVYEKDYELTWLRNQQNPFFLCFADTETLTVELFSTWHMLDGFLAASDATRIVLVPENDGEVVRPIETEADRSEQRISLGQAVLRIHAQEVVDPTRVGALAAAMREWVELDRQNIVNRSAGMYWVTGPVAYATNSSPHAATQAATSFYWNANNLQICERNLARTATALRLVHRSRGAAHEESSPVLDRIRTLQDLLRAHSTSLDPLGVDALRKSGFDPSS